MRYHKLSAYVILLLFGLGNIFPLSLAAEHSQQIPAWIDHSRNGVGYPCCGKQDCFPVINTAILEMRGEKVLVIINGIIGEILYKALVPSEDERDYVCLEDTFANGGEWVPCWSHRPDGALDIEVREECIRCLFISARN